MNCEKCGKYIGEENPWGYCSPDCKRKHELELNNSYKIIHKVSCGLCGFPDNITIGKIMCMGKTTVECLKQHFLEEHPHKYRSLLREIKERIPTGKANSEEK